MEALTPPRRLWTSSDGQTLSPGGVVTVSGTPASYAAAGTDVGVGTSTEAVGIGGLIVSGFGSVSASTRVVGSTGGAVEGGKWLQWFWQLRWGYHYE